MAKLSSCRMVRPFNELGVQNLEGSAALSNCCMVILRLAGDTFGHRQKI